MHFEILTIDKANEWSKNLDAFPDQNKDIYYTPQYYSTWIEHEKAVPYCIFFKANKYKLLYPFFKKPIEANGLNGTYYDIFSAYGYGGVIANNSSENVTTAVINSFNAKFNDWCKENNIIAEFIRENPLVVTDKHFIRDAQFMSVRKNVYVPISEDYVIPNSNCRRKIRKALKNGLWIETDECFDSLWRFQELYAQTAERLCMDVYYRFDNQYFKNVATYLEPNAKIINIKWNDITIAATIILFHSGKVTYHLGCSDLTYSKLYPNDLLMKAIIDESIKMDANLVSLGGGTTNCEDDPLFLFKNRFGAMTLEVKIGKKIHNAEVYHTLCRQWEIAYPQLVNKYKNYFLKYRMTK